MFMAHTVGMPVCETILYNYKYQSAGAVKRKKKVFVARIIQNTAIYYAGKM